MILQSQNLKFLGIRETVKNIVDYFFRFIWNANFYASYHCNITDFLKLAFSSLTSKVIKETMFDRDAVF